MLNKIKWKSIENTNTDYSVASTSSSYSCSSATVSVPYSSKQRLPFLKPRDDKVSAFMPVMKSEASTVVISSSSKTSHCSGREICENRKNEDKSGKLSDRSFNCWITFLTFTKSLNAVDLSNKYVKRRWKKCNYIN